MSEKKKREKHFCAQCGAEVVGAPGELAYRLRISTSKKLYCSIACSALSRKDK